MTRGARHPGTDVPDDTPEEVPFAPLVVAIGASPGALPRLRGFFGALPTRSGYCFLLTQHVAADQEHLPVETLAPIVARPVALAEDGAAVAPDTVLVIPPGMRPGFRAGQLWLRRARRGSGRGDPVDRLLLAVAEAFGPRAVGVVLAGTGADGAMGLQAVSGAGGLAMAEEGAATGLSDGAPGATAIGLDFADYVATPKALAAALAEHDRHRRARLGGAGEAAQQRAAALASLTEVCALLRDRTGHDFRHYKASTLVRRLERRMRVLRLDTVDAYLERLRTDAQEPGILFRELLVGVTAFFRDPEAFQVLAERAITPLLARRAAEEPLRIWVAGCATGEEAYSVAILVREAMDSLKRPQQVQIFATDVNDRALAVARRGVYPASLAGQISPERLARFFTRRGRQWQVGEELRAMCLFSPHNVIADPPFSRLDLICCRNLLIYLGAHLQKKLIPLFHYALKPDGFLFLGASETLAGHAELFRPVDARQRLAQRKSTHGVALPARPEPRLPGTPATMLAASSSPRDGAASVHAPWREAAGGVLPPAEAELGAIAQRILLDEFAPAYAIVTGEGHLVFLSERADRFLQPPAGSFTSSITRMARRGLGIGLRAALSDAVRTRRTAVRDGLMLQGPEGLVPVRLTAQPMPELGYGEGLYMLVFQESSAAPATGRGGKRQGSTRTPDAEVVIGQLEQELVRTREDLERAVQDLEAANEELKASNEELLSMNEELQSSNEELETSKEEVQAANAALAAANADLENLLHATRIATIFLDREGRVRGFTPAATEIYPVTAQDVGRPLSHLTHRLRDVPPLPDPATMRAAAEGTPIEHEAESEDGRWFLRRVLPYRGPGGEADGLVVTFLDITRRKLDERALLDAEERLRLSQEAGGIGTWDWEVGTQKVHWSDQIPRLFGLSPATPASYPAFLERVHPEDRPTLEGAIEAAAGHRTPDLRAEFRVLAGDTGELRWIATRGEVERAAAGRPLRVRGVALDVTEQRAAETALRESEARLRDLLATLDLGAFMARDLDGTIRFWSAGAEHLYGWTVAEAVGRDAHELLRTVFPMPRAEILTALERDGEWTGDLRQRTRDGVEIIVTAHKALRRGPDGRPVAVLESLTDVTAQRRAEAALADSEARLRDLLATLDLGAFMARDLDGRIRFWSAGSEQLYGWTAAEAVGQDAHELLRTIFPVPRPEIAAALERDGEWTGDLRQRIRNGTEVVVAARKVLRRGPDGRPVAVLESLTDVTAHRRVEAALAESEAQLRAAVEGSPFPIMLHAEDGEVVALSRSWTELSGFGPEEIPTHSAWLRLAYPDRHQEIEALLEEEFTAGEVVRTGERTIHTKSGEARIWDVQAVPLGRLPDGRGLRMSAAVDVTERKHTEEQRLLLAREVDHRAKNALAVVQALLRLTPARKEETRLFAATVADRVAAVARAHGLLSRERWVGAELRALLEEELAPYAMDAPARVRLTGPAVRLTVNAALSLSMVLHELATNAAKHGAFSAPDGQVAVAWVQDPVGGKLRLDWREIGGPPVKVQPPSGDRKGGGFGSRLIARTVRQLGGNIEYTWDLTGLHCTLHLPCDRLGAAAVEDTTNPA